MEVLKLLAVDDTCYTKALQLRAKPYTWQAFHETDAQNLIINSYILMCVPPSEWFINPYLESIYSVHCAYIKKVNLLLSSSCFLQLANEEEKYELASVLLQRLDTEAVRRGIAFQSCAFSKKQQVEQCEWDQVDRTFLQAQKEDLLKLFHLMNAQCFFERVVDELLTQFWLQNNKKTRLGHNLIF